VIGRYNAGIGGRVELDLGVPAPASRRSLCVRPMARAVTTVERNEGLLRTRPDQLIASCLVNAPAVLERLRPVILTPVGLLAGLAAGQVEAILLHALCAYPH
jgi:hypothetical protein